MKKFIILFSAVLGFQSTALAGLLFEPYFGYQSMTTNLKTGSAVGSYALKLEGAGIGVGFRFGYTGTLLFLALDYGAATLSTKQKEGAIPISPGNSLHSNTGVTFGLNFPFVRPYAGYIFDSQFIGSDSGLTGTGSKAGLGFSFSPKILINLEYSASTFNKYQESSVVSLPNDLTYESASIAGFTLNISAPFSF